VGGAAVTVPRLGCCVSVGVQDCCRKCRSGTGIGAPTYGNEVVADRG